MHEPAAQVRLGWTAQQGTVERARIPALDGVRGLAISLVLAWHYGAGQRVPGMHPVTDAITSWMRLGWAGVDLFFVLSGCLIGGILIDHRDSPNLMRVFYLRRTARIFPLYFALMTFGGVLLLFQHAHIVPFALTRGALPLLPHLAFLQNFWMGVSFGAPWTSATWSLAIEEQFYLVIPLVVRLMPRRTLPLLLVALIAAAITARHFAAQIAPLYPFVLLPCRWDALSAGVLVAILLRSEWLTRVPRRVVRWSGVAAALLACSLLLSFSFADFLSIPLLCALGFTVTSLSFGILVLAIAHDDGALARLFSGRVLAWLGSISFACT